MLYLSTRGEAQKLGFSDALLAGLARDGGLYVPDVMPRLSQGAIEALAGAPYAEAAAQIILPFVDDANGLKAGGAVGRPIPKPSGLG